MNERGRSSWRVVVRAVLTALLSAVLAVVLGLAVMWWGVYFVSVREHSGDLVGVFALIFIATAAMLAALTGFVLAAVRPARASPWLWLHILVVTAAVSIAVCAGPRLFYDLSMPAMILTCALLVPTSATSAYALLVRRPGRPLRFRPRVVGIALGLEVLLALALVAQGWQKGSRAVTDIAVSRSGRIYVATESGLFAADSMRDTWHRLPCGRWDTQAWRVAVSLPHPEMVWAEVGNEKWGGVHLQWSSDRGRHWSQATEIDPKEMPGRLISTDAGLYALDSWNNGLLRNESGKPESWQTRPIRLAGLSHGDMRNLAVNPRRTDSMLAGMSGTTVRQDGTEVHILAVTHDSGQTWKALKLPASWLGRTAMWDVALVPGNPEKLVVTGSYDMLVSPDDGRSWRRISYPRGATYANGRAACESLCVAPTDPPTIYLWGSKGAYASGDCGATWRRIHPSGNRDASTPVACIVVDPSDARTVYAGLRGGLYRSGDSGRTWDRIR